jgi:signal transduction histidine kinase
MVADRHVGRAAVARPPARQWWLRTMAGLAGANHRGAMSSALALGRAPATQTAAGPDAATVPSAAPSSWFALLLTTRLLGAALAIALLAVHHVTGRDPALLAATAAWTTVSLLLFRRAVRWRRRPAAWVIDAGAALALVWLSGDWRSPFYVFALTTLVLPSTWLAFRDAMLWACGFTAAYLAVAVATELDTGTLRSSIRVETVATHLMVPIVVALALAYAAGLVRRLREEQERTERLAIQAERQRIAWELHDSAKQRVHAAHLVLSAAADAATDGVRAGIDHALAELRAAAADMDTSVAELRAPLDNRPVDEMLRRRAAELAAAASARIDVLGTLPRLHPLVAVHAYRIASEALTNAVRHSGAERIDIRLDPDPHGPVVRVCDDGAGLPAQPRPGAHGLRTMRSRAESIGATVDVGAGPGGRGTEVVLRLPPQGRGDDIR